MKRVYWWLRVIALSIRWINKYNLGDKVFHGDRVWILTQGVSAPLWNLQNEYERKEYVHENEFRKVSSLSNYWRSFKSGYRFYMMNWFDIWVRDGIESWMLSCNIWAKQSKRKGKK